MSQGYLIGKMSQAKKRITPLIGEVLPFDMGRPYRGWAALTNPGLAAKLILETINHNLQILYSDWVQACALTLFCNATNNGFPNPSTVPPVLLSSLCFSLGAPSMGTKDINVLSDSC